MGAASKRETPGVRLPTKAELLAAGSRTVPDVIAPGLKLLFCGINPGLYSAWAGHHFARPGNRFWPVLFHSGFTDRLLRPEEERQLLSLGLGITNIVDRASAAADELNPEELIAGAAKLEKKIRGNRIGAVAILGVSAFRVAFKTPGAALGKRPEKIGGAVVWVLPNPSGLNAHFTPVALARKFHELGRELEMA